MGNGAIGYRAHPRLYCSPGIVGNNIWHLVGRLTGSATRRHPAGKCIDLPGFLSGFGSLVVHHGFVEVRVGQYKLLDHRIQGPKLGA